MRLNNHETMTTISGSINSTSSYVSLNSMQGANSNANNQSTGNGNTMTTGTPKFIQLQTVPQTAVQQTSMTPSVSAPLLNQGQRVATTNIQGQSAQQRNINIPPGMVLTRTSSGQLVLVNGSQLSTGTNASQQISNTQTVTTATRVLPTQASTSSAPNPSVTTVGKPVSVPSPVSVSTTPAKTPEPSQNNQPTNSTPVALTQDDITNVNKCRNFLTTLIKLASTGGQLQETVRNVKALVQNLIDDKITPEDFTKRLQTELKSSPQPYLVPFLKKSLPLLRLTMMQQSQGGPVPPAVVAAANRVSALTSDKSPSSPRPKLNNNKLQKTPLTKNFRNTVPDIRLPRVTSNGPPLKHPSLQQPFQQAPHPSLVSGARSSSLTAMRPPIYGGVPTRGNQRYGAGGGSGGGGGGTYKEDDDINDVASMAGVNLAEESSNILATNSELVGTQTRSCTDRTVLNSAVLQKRMSEIASKNPSIEHIHSDSVKLLTCAAEYRLKEILEKLSTVVCHRMTNYKEEPHYNACNDVKTQLKFLQELDHIEKKKHDEAERDILMRAMKSRSKNDNPEQLRLKERAKEMQQQEMEKLQIRNADETARNAIGPRRKKPKIEAGSTGGTYDPVSTHSSTSTSKPTSRSRMKRVNLKDLMFVLEHEKASCKSSHLYNSFLK